MDYQWKSEGNSGFGPWTSSCGDSIIEDPLGNLFTVKNNLNKNILLASYLNEEKQTETFESLSEHQLRSMSMGSLINNEISSQLVDNIKSLKALKSLLLLQTRPSISIRHHQSIVTSDQIFDSSRASDPPEVLLRPININWKADSCSIDIEHQSNSELSARSSTSKFSKLTRYILPEGCSTVCLHKDSLPPPRTVASGHHPTFRRVLIPAVHVRLTPNATQSSFHEPRLLRSSRADPHPPPAYSTSQVGPLVHSTSASELGDSSEHSPPQPTYGRRPGHLTF